jgi:hypothetical protein
MLSWRHEVIHSLKSSDTPGMLINLDLSKSFDKLSWKYMHSLLLAFGFNENWVNWIMTLTSLYFFSILINGVPSHPFSPSRGILQGDPLSPSFSSSWMKVLATTSRLTSMMALSKAFPYMVLHPPISHNQFVDDTMMMGVPTTREAHDASLTSSKF